MGALIRRDLRLAFRHKTGWLMGPIFYLLFLTLSIIALKPSGLDLAKFAGPLIWLATLFSLLLTFPVLFARDYEDGTLEALLLSGTGRGNIIISKAVVFFILSILPLLAVIPFAGLALSMPPSAMAGAGLSILIAAPTLIAYGVLTGALLARENSGGFLAIIIAVPLVLPVMIFGLSAMDAYAVQGLGSVEFKALAGINLIALAVGLPAAAAALSANLE